MFRDLINKPIDPIPVEYVATLQRVSNEPDYSLTCLGLAMLKSRIEEYKGITGIYYSFIEKGACITDFIDRMRSIDECPLFCYYRYSKDTFNQAEIDEHLADFKEKKSITAFVKEKTGSDCMVLYHEEKNAVAIIVNSNDMRLYHLLLSFVSLYFPSLFKDKPLAEDDYNLIKSLSKKDKMDFFKCVKTMVEPYVIEFRKVQMMNFMKQLHEQKLNAAQQMVQAKRYDVQQIEERYANLIRALRDAIVQFEGLKATENYDAPEENLVEYLATNRNIHNLSIRNNKIYFSVTTLLNNYNEQAWKTFSERGHIYDGEYGTRLTSEVFKDRNNRKRLLDVIFSDDPELMIRMAGNYCLNLNEFRVSTDDCYNYVDADPIFKDYMPNPHLKLFSCLGGYKDRVMHALADRNYIGAIELCIASAGSVNLDETTQTFRPFLGWVLNSTDKILVTKDGKEMTPEEALLWLIDKEKKDE